MKLARKGQTISPVKITGRTIASTFWGKAWCDNLERYRDFENRLPRGRTYVRNGSVLDLQIERCAVRAMVSGSSLYHVSIGIDVLSKPQWQSICGDCTGAIDSVVELLQGQLSKSVMERVCQAGRGLFPEPSEIRFTCSCPDAAFMCKHIAATLYGVGARLDQQPELLFKLRDVDQTELIGSLDGGLLKKTTPDAAKILADDDISALFGLDMVDDSSSATTSMTTKATRSKAAKSERSKSSTATVPPKRVTSSGAFAATPKRRRPAKATAPVPPNATEKTAAPRNAAQLATTTKRRKAVAKPKQASGAVALPSSTSEVQPNSATEPARKRSRVASAGEDAQPVKWWLPSYRTGKRRR